MRGVSYAPPRKPVITDSSLEDVNRIIFSPWDAISGYEEPVTDSVVDIPGNIGALAGDDGKRKNKNESSPTPAAEQIANKLKTTNEEERPNKSASFSQLHMTVESVHFHKVSRYLLLPLQIIIITIKTKGKHTSSSASDIKISS